MRALQTLIALFLMASLTLFASAGCRRGKSPDTAETVPANLSVDDVTPVLENAGFTVRVVESDSRMKELAAHYMSQSDYLLEVNDNKLGLLVFDLMDEGAQRNIDLAIEKELDILQYHNLLISDHNRHPEIYDILEVLDQL